MQFAHEQKVKDEKLQAIKFIVTEGFWVTIYGSSCDSHQSHPVSGLKTVIHRCQQNLTDFQSQNDFTLRMFVLVWNTAYPLKTF